MRLPTAEEIQIVCATVASVAAGFKWLGPRAVTASAAVRKFIEGLNRTINKVDTIEGKVTAIEQRVESELGRNGGASLKDLVTIIEARQTAIFDRMERAGFEARADGSFKSVNRAFEKLTGFPARDLLEMGWVNLLHQDELEDFMEVWCHAIRDGRQLRRTCRIVTSDSRELLVYVDAAPVKVAGVVREWQGTFAQPEASA